MSASAKGVPFPASGWPTAPGRALALGVLLAGVLLGGLLLLGPLGTAALQSSGLALGVGVLLASLLDLAWRPQELRLTATDLVIVYRGKTVSQPISRITGVQVIDRARLPLAIPLWPLGAWRGATVMMGRHWVVGRGVWTFHCQRPSGPVLVIETLRGPLVVSPDQPTVLRDRLVARLQTRVLGYAS